MCRLCLVLPKKEDLDPRISMAIITRMLIHNSYDRGNTDGTGIAAVSDTNVQYYKSTDAAFNFLQKDAWMKRLDNDWSLYLKQPWVSFMGHVRAASAGVPVAVENSHPFIANGIIAEHNGNIANKEVFSKNEVSDSFAFFKYVGKQTENGILSFSILREALSKARGSWCMLLHDRKDEDRRKFWVVTGDKRELYISENEYYYLINTTPAGIHAVDDLSTCLGVLGSNLPSEMFQFPLPTKIEKERVYTLTSSGLEEHGKVLELASYSSGSTPISKGVHSYRDATPREPGWWKSNRISGNSQDTESARNQECAEAWFKIRRKGGLTETEILIILRRIDDKKINENMRRWYELDIKSLERILEIITQAEKEEFLEDLDVKLEIWDRILLASFTKRYDILETYELLNEETKGSFNFPFWGNDISTLEIAEDIIAGVKPMEYTL